LKLVRQFEDHGGRRHEAAIRPDFQLMLKAVRSGEIDWVVVDALDRVGFGDPFECISILHEFRKFGCELWSTQGDKPLTSLDPASFLTAGIGAIGSRDEMVKLASRNVGAKLAMSQRGEWTGGKVPYGCDIACRNPESVERWRVVIVGDLRRLKVQPDGTAEVYDGKDNWPRDRRPGDILAVVPSVRAERLVTVRQIFEWWTTETVSYNRIAVRLNEAGITHHAGGVWYPGLVQQLLHNPVYVGKPGWNKNTFARYACLDGDGRVTTDLPQANPKLKRAIRRRPMGEWVLPNRPMLDPIVDPEVWERAQAKLADRKTPTRNPKSDRLYLSGILYCARCGGRMIAWNCTSARGEGWQFSYTCPSYRRDGRFNRAGCGHHRVKADVVERLVADYLEQADRLAGAVHDAGDGGGLISLLYDGRNELYERLACLRRGMEDYLYDALTEIADHRDLGGGPREFVIDYPDGPITLELPGCRDASGLREVYSWVSQARTHRDRGKIAGLEAELLALYRKWDELPTPATKAICKREMQRVEAELERLRADEGVPLAVQAGALTAQLLRQQVLIRKARRELDGPNYRRLGEAVRRVVDRVDLHFEPFIRGKQAMTRLVRADVIPLLDGSPKPYEFGNEGAPRRSS
jgi:hypothetical protein